VFYNTNESFAKRKKEMNILVKRMLAMKTISAHKNLLMINKLNKHDVT